MKKRIYLRIHPENAQKDKLDELLEESLDKIVQVKNVEKAEGQVGSFGKVKQLSKDSYFARKKAP